MKIILKIRYFKYCNDRIDISEEINSNNSKKCMISNYLFFDHGFKFEDYVCNGYHGLTILRVNISDIAIITIIVVLFILLANHWFYSWLI